MLKINISVSFVDIKGAEMILKTQPRIFNTLEIVGFEQYIFEKENSCLNAGHI